MRHVIQKKGGILLCAFLTLSLALLFWPVDLLVVSEGDRVVFTAPLFNGAPFITRYEHSVEKTLVEDEYRMVSGALWGWEERIRSHNAGLPSQAPQQGRFLVRDAFFCVQGGRMRFQEIVYRVGNKQLGKNEWLFPMGNNLLMHRLYPNARLIIRTESTPLWQLLRAPDPAH